MALWDDIIPSEDLKMFSKCKMGGSIWKESRHYRR